MSLEHVETRPIRPGEELDLPRLSEFLRDHVPGFAGDLRVSQFPHGHSNLTYLLQSGTHSWVLRRPPFGNQVKSAHDMGREYRVLSGLSPVFAPAPRPLAACADDSILGAPFYVMEMRSGLILRREWPSHLPRDPALLRRMCETLIDTLADLHSLDPRDAGLQDLGKPEGYVQRQIQGWTKRYRDAQTSDIPDMDATAEWLASHMPAESGVSLIHNDFKFDNVAFSPNQPDQIVAVFDWEMTTLGDPLMDLGTSLGYWVEPQEMGKLSEAVVGPTGLPGALSRAELVERYATRRGLTNLDARYYYVYGLFKIAVIIQQIYVRFVRGFTQDPRFAQLEIRVRQLAEQATAEISK